MYELCPKFQNAIFPDPSDQEKSSLGFTRWNESILSSGNSQLSKTHESTLKYEKFNQILSSIFGNSPYLTQICLSDPEFAFQLLQDGVDKTAENIISGLKSKPLSGFTQDSLSQALRQTKSQMALCIALADIADLWALDTTTGWLSILAETTLQKACDFVLLETAAKGVFTLKHPETPSLESGYIILGMGKLGARELNYSSDIDLIVLFDPHLIQTDDYASLQKHCVRMTKTLVRLMDERTAHGYVFRTDLRLRPDPSATPLAVSVPAAEVYYESQGQNWERAAMIKARPVAGDLEAGKAFLKWLTPFIWRKNLDFAAIEDIHSIKRQINAHRGGTTVAVAGHNIKLGRGGIREIEFFAQTQQLIWGGRQPNLRQPKTTDTINTLVECGMANITTGQDLITAYAFLRKVEHRLQMTNDQQSQTLPDNDTGLFELAIFLGFADKDSFASMMTKQLRTVESHYAVLFKDAPGLSAKGDVSGNLVFTGSDSDPDTIKTIGGYGFQNPETVDTAIRGWHHGRYRAMRSTRAREMLTALTPALLSVLGNTPDPDNTFLKFDEFLSGLPAGVQLFSMLNSNQQLLTLLAHILGEAPRLAEQLSRKPSLFDSVLSSDFLDIAPSQEQLTEQLGRALSHVEYFEDALNITRRWANDRKFQIGLQSLQGTLNPTQAARGLSDMAEVILNGLFPCVEDEFAKSHGTIKGGKFCTIALGKLGGREVTPTSDLDMVFIYDVPEDAEYSDGAKPLSPTQYYARLGQRLINALSVQTAEGMLYEVDMRLRPSGNAGPIACTLEAFETYHRETSWIWEHMALTRARCVTGNQDIRKQVSTTIRDLIAQPHEPTKLLFEVADMRQRMDREHHTESPWVIKHFRGGLIDIEFIAQYLQLLYAQQDRSVVSPNTWQAFQNLSEAGHLSHEDAALLMTTLEIWQAYQSRLHLTIETDEPRNGIGAMPIALQKKLPALGGAADIDGMEKVIRALATQTFELYQRIIGDPVLLEDDGTVL